MIGSEPNPRLTDYVPLHAAGPPWRRGTLFLLTLVMGVAGCDRRLRAPEFPSNEPIAPNAHSTSTDVVPRAELAIVADGLRNPTGVAVQPRTGHVFVTSLDGVTRFVPEESFKAYTEVSGFSADSYGAGPRYQFGPLGLAFLDSTTLIVGGGGQPDGQDMIHFYTIEPTPSDAHEPQQASESAFQLGPVPPGRDALRGEGNFFGLALHGRYLYMTSHGDDTKGWLHRVALRNGRPTRIEPWIPTKRLLALDAPTAIVADDHRLLVAQFGEVYSHPDSLIAAYETTSGDLVATYPTGLYDIVAIAKHPHTGELYALDFCWARPELGGLFRLALRNTSADANRATRIAAIVKPTAMAFAPDGTLYVAAIDRSNLDDTLESGKLFACRLTESASP